MRLHGLLLALGLCTATVTAGPSEMMTNASVIELQQLGLGDGVILEKLRGAETDFDVTLEGLRKLKGAGISPAVITEMIRLSKKTGETATAAKTEEAGRNDPLAPHEGGIYYYDDTVDSPTLTLLEPTVYQQTKSGGFWKSSLTYGIAKVKSKAVLNGARAALQLSTRKPVFYFYFEATHSDLRGRARITSHRAMQF